MKKILFFLSLLFLNCALSNHYWSPIIEPIDKLKHVELNGRVKLILRNRHEIKGVLLERGEDQAILLIIKPDSIKGQTKSFPFADIRGIVTEKNMNQNHCCV